MYSHSGFLDNFNDNLTIFPCEVKIFIRYFILLEATYRVVYTNNDFSRYQTTFER